MKIAIRGALGLCLHREQWGVLGTPLPMSPCGADDVIKRDDVIETRRYATLKPLRSSVESKHIQIVD